MRNARSLLLLALVSLLASCGGNGGIAPKAAAPTERASPSRVSGAAPASPTAATLVKVANGPEVERRLGYANLEALSAAQLPVRQAQVLEQVLGPGAKVADGDRGTVVQVANATVLEGSRVIGASRKLERSLREAAPQTSAITPPAPSAAQSCLGDTLAQTILGPGTMGADAALGVGLAESGDAPAGIQLRICGAPRLIRHLHAMEHAMRSRFGRLGERAKIEEREIGEREIVTGTIAAGSLEPDALLELLGGGRELRTLGWH